MINVDLHIFIHIDTYIHTFRYILMQYIYMFYIFSSNEIFIYTRVLSGRNT